MNDADFTSPSISIKSSEDKVGAIKSAASGGHLEFDVYSIVASHLDIDVAADKASAHSQPNPNVAVQTWIGFR